MSEELIGCVNDKCSLGVFCTRLVEHKDNRFKQTTKFRPKQDKEGNVSCVYFINKHQTPKLGGGVKPWR